MDVQLKDRSHLFNNAGARVLSAGNVQVALDLFRGALEAKLSYERTLRPRGDFISEHPLSPIVRCVTPDCVSTAENHLAQMDSIILRMDDGEPSSHMGEVLITHAPSATTRTEVRPTHVGTVVPEDCRGYCPYFYRTPFELTDGSRSSTELTSAIIVFNLGLVHHHEWMNSPKAAAFYEISAALLASETDTPQAVLLKIALLNNFGIWCYENGDGESLRTCMEHLSSVVKHTSVPLSSEVTEGVRANVKWLLTPPNGGSPAA
jgi:hypothetical protein